VPKRSTTKKSTRRTPRKRGSARSGFWPDKAFGLYLLFIGLCSPTLIYFLFLPSVKATGVSLKKLGLTHPSLAPYNLAHLLAVLVIVAAVWNLVCGIGIFRSRRWGFWCYGLGGVASVAVGAWITFSPAFLTLSASDSFSNPGGGGCACFPAIYCVLRLFGWVGPRLS
jgi:hypothetical protein